MVIIFNIEKGNVYEEVEIDLDGDYLDIVFNFRYFIEGLKNIDNEEIFIEFIINVNFCIIKLIDDVNYIYLLFLVRILLNI